MTKDDLEQIRQLFREEFDRAFTPAFNQAFDLALDQAIEVKIKPLIRQEIAFGTKQLATRKELDKLSDKVDRLFLFLDERIVDVVNKVRKISYNFGEI